MECKAPGNGGGGGDRGRTPDNDYRQNDRERCSCGRPKYWDAVCCEDCWKNHDPFDRR